MTTDTVAESTVEPPPPRHPRRWPVAVVVVLLGVIAVGYMALSAYQSRDSGQDKQRAASARNLVYEWPSKVQRRIYDIPIPDGSTYVGHYEINTWDRSTMYVQFRTSPDQLGVFMESIGSEQAALAEDAGAIAPDVADVVGWRLDEPDRQYAGAAVRQSDERPKVSVTVDVTSPERPRVYVVSVSEP